MAEQVILEEFMLGCIYEWDKVGVGECPRDSKDCVRGRGGGKPHRQNEGGYISS